MVNISRKHSKKRDEILRILRSAATHPSAQWVYEQLKPSIPGLSLGTVYRNINLFLQEGSVVSVCVVDGKERFDGVVAPHPHCVCTCCGGVFDVPCLDFHFDAVILEGFTIDYQKTVFYGICADCEQK
jgi:Fur family peroxide stress response transcriptional regulator